MPIAVLKNPANLVPVVRSFGRARRRGAVAKQSLRPSEGPDRLLDAGDEGVVVLTRLRRQRVAEGDAGGMPAGGPAETRESLLKGRRIRRRGPDRGTDRQERGAL